MQKLYIDGMEVEMSQDVSGFQFTSAVEGIDKRHASRSASIKIPMTPRNQIVFGFPTHPDQWGGGVRGSHNAELYYDGGVARGQFKITSVSGDSVSGSMVYGEQVALLQDQFTKPIGELIQPTDNIEMLSGAYFYENSRNLNTPIYFDGSFDAPSKGFHLPTVSVNYLLNECANKLGFSISVALQILIGNHRLVLPTLNKAGTMVANGSFTASASGYSLPAGASAYFNEELMMVSDEDGGYTHAVRVLRCIQACKVRIFGTNDLGAASEATLEENLRNAKNNNGFYKFTPDVWRNGNAPKKGSEISASVVYRDYMRDCQFECECEVGDVIAWMHYNWQPVAFVDPKRRWTNPTTRFFTMQVSGLGGSLERIWNGVYNTWSMGTYYLSANMPNISIKDLLSAITRLDNVELTYDESTGKFDIFGYNFDYFADSVISLDDVGVVNSVTRNTLDYGQRHVTSLKMESGWDYSDADVSAAQYVLNTPNLNLTEETKSEIGVLASPTKPDGTKSTSFIPCCEIDGDGLPTAKTISGLVLALGYQHPDDGDSRRLTRTSTFENPHKVRIAQLSTSCEVEYPMPLYKFMQIRTTTRFTLRGCWWFCRTATWQNGTCKLKLQRYK